MPVSYGLNILSHPVNITEYTQTHTHRLNISQILLIGVQNEKKIGCYERIMEGSNLTWD